MQEMTYLRDCHFSLNLLNYKWQNVGSKISEIMFCVLKDTLAITVSHSSQRGSWFFSLPIPIIYASVVQVVKHQNKISCYLSSASTWQKKKTKLNKKKWPGRKSNLQGRDIWSQLFGKYFVVRGVNGPASWLSFK